MNKLLPCLAAAVLALAACSSPQAPESRLGTLAISISEEVSTRNLVPALVMSPASYVISGSHGTEVFTRTVDSSASTVTVEKLSFGSWAITVEAYNNDPTPTLIGTGTAADVNIATNSTTAVSIAVQALAGTGSLSLAASWTGTVDSGTLTGTLTPAGGTAIAFSLDPSLGPYTKTDLATGYYALSLQLIERGTAVAGATETVRIVKDQTTSGTISFGDVRGAGGSLAVSFTTNMQNPIPVSVGRSSATISTMGRLNFSAARTDQSAASPFAWYVNGADPSLVSGLKTDSSLSLPTDLVTGYYRVDALASVAGQGGSGSFVLGWKGQHASPPSSPAAGWAYYDTNTCLPYTYDTGAAAWIPFSTMPVHLASLSLTDPAAGLAWDPDMDPPQNAAGAGPPGFGASSFTANVTGTGSRAYTSFRFVPHVLLGLSSPIALNDIKAISFYTRQAAASTRTWQLRIYTLNPNASSSAKAGDPKFWYLTRINAVITSPASTGWLLNSTSAASNPANLILFNKVTILGDTTAEQRLSTPIGLQDAKTGISATVTNGSSIIAPHGSELIYFIDIGAGDNNKAPVQALLDGVILSTTGGKALVLDLGD
jgi:hypothetical protein